MAGSFAADSWCLADIGSLLNGSGGIREPRRREASAAGGSAGGSTSTELHTFRASSPQFVTGRRRSLKDQSGPYSTVRRSFGTASLTCNSPKSAKRRSA